MPAGQPCRALAPLTAAVIAILGALSAGPGGAAPLAPPIAPDRLACVAPLDVLGIDRVLGAARSPMAGQGDAIVEGARQVGLDPRAIVAIAAHETLLETYGPARVIHNPFGLGPGMRFSTEREAILTAARVLGEGYLAQGLVRIPDIGRKWAPVGAVNDPTDLNSAWPTGVAAYYAALGGDPDRPLLLSAQDPTPACAAESPAAGGSGPSVVTMWGGRPPLTSGPRMDQGGDPVTGEPASIPGFVFPLAAPSGALVGYHDAFTDPGAPGCYGRRWRCAIPITSAPGMSVVAASDGVLVAAGRADAAQGLAFWIARPDGDRVGYSGLASYAPGIAAGVAVRAGQPLGTGTGSLLIAWIRHGLRVNPYGLLRATRPSDA
jgi:hypothetical protein